MTNRMYQMIFTFPGTQHPDVCSVMAESPHDAETELHRTMNRYGFPPVVLNVLSVIVAGTAEAGQALLNAQKVEA